MATNMESEPEVTLLSKYIGPGNRLQLQKIYRLKADAGKERNTYESRVIDVISEDIIEIGMPFEKTKLILLSVDEEYNLFFYTTNGLYQCSARVIDRYKNSNVFSVRLELTSNLRKFNRRQYYRFSCALDMHSRALEKDEVQIIEMPNRNTDIYRFYPELEMPLQRSIIVDISGGGLRFVASYAYEINSIILIKYFLWIAEENREFNLYGKVLSVKPVENRPGVFEHRVQYVNMDDDDREGIIRYIFNAERQTLQKTRYRESDEWEENT